MRIKDAIDNIFSHNEIVAIWEREYKFYDKLVWQGMAWDMPKKYKEIEKWRIFGLIPENIDEADHINILIMEE